jgi:hypothetical protein
MGNSLISCISMSVLRKIGYGPKIYFVQGSVHVINLWPISCSKVSQYKL